MNLNLGTIIDLPSPPAEKKGWPWINVKTTGLPVMTNGKPWPKISIVTPSFNQGQFLEETIRSVLMQNYPNLEYIIIDGGSCDNSVEIIRKYEPWISYWVSEKDNGQAHAINKGLELCTGEIFNWINSDDYLMPNALRIIAEGIYDFDVVAGSVTNFSVTSEDTIQSTELVVKKMIAGDTAVIYQQPGTWLRTNNLKNVGLLDEDFNYSFDWLMTINYLNKHPKVNYITDTLVKFRLHHDSKTVKYGLEFRREILLISIGFVYHKDYRDKYGSEAIKCLQKYLWTEEIDMLRLNSFSSLNKSKSILTVLFRNIIFYPYRYAFGTIKRIILKA
jgi:glycosyltransferase involved in cell wall biosynthesis